MNKKTCPHCGARYCTRKSSDRGMVCRACEKPVALVNNRWYKQREDAPEFKLVKKVRDEFDLGFPLQGQYNKYRMAMRGADMFLSRCDGDIELALATVDEMLRDNWMRQHCSGVMWLLNDKLFWKYFAKAKRRIKAKSERAKKERVREQGLAPANMGDW